MNIDKPHKQKHAQSIQCRLFLFRWSNRWGY